MGDASGISVLLVDDNPSVHQNLQCLARKYPQIHLVGQVNHREDALECVRLLRPNVVLINIHTRRMDVVSTAREIRLCYPTVVVMGLNVFAQENGHLRRSKREEDTAERFRALGGPILHTIWKNRGHSDGKIPPHERIC